MKNITIIGRERFAVSAIKLLKKRGFTIDKVITDSQGILFQHAQLSGITCQLKNSSSKVTACDIGDDTDIILSLHNYLYIRPDAINKADKAIGYHPSLLPAYPGRRAIQEALKDNQAATGGTLFNLDSGYDTGEIVSQQVVPIYDGDTPKTLWARLEVAGLALLTIEATQWG